ncbi:MAG: class I SAM-dependent methyltransferase [Acidobacteriota bacterium]
MALTDPRPTSEQLDQSYSEAYYGPENVKFVSPVERFVRWQTAQRARWIHRLIPGNSRVLELGCGRGALLEELAQLGHEAYGTERSELAARRARRSVGVHVFSEDLQDCRFPSDRFDAVILWHVLEHLGDVSSALEEICRILRPQGVLILEVPNLDSLQATLSGRHWFHLDVERHLYHFGPNNIRSLLTRHGFRPGPIGTFSLEQGPYGVLQSAMNHFSDEPELLYRILKREIRLSRWQSLVQYGSGALLFLPAIVFACFEAAVGRGSVLRIVAPKAGVTPTSPP